MIQLQVQPSRSQLIDSLSVKAEGSGWLWIAIFSIVYFPLTILRAAARPMWFDELFTFYISRLDLAKIWAILSSGSEPNPPLCYVLTHASMRLFGENEIAVRLPEIIGYWLMSICIFFFVRRRCSALPAAAAMLFPLSTKAYLQYSVEARPYGMVLGFCALAAFCWQCASDSASARTRAIATAGFSLALMAALCSHYYSVLLLIPFGVGELVRWWKTGWLNKSLSAALVLSLLPLIPLSSALKRGSGFITHFVKASPVFWAKPTPTAIPLFYIESLAGTLAPLLLTAIVVVMFEVFWRRDKTASQDSLRQPPLHEIAMIVTLTAIPAFAAVIGVLATGSFIARYALSALVGCSMLFGFLVYRGSKGRFSIAAASVLVFFGWFFVNGLHKPNSVAKQPVPDLSRVDRSLPVVVSNPLVFLKLLHYGSHDLVSRMHYLSDLETVVKKPDFVPELALDELKKWISIPVEDYRSFVSAHPRFAVYYSSEPTLEWVADKLAADGHDVHLQSQKDDDQVFQVNTTAGK